MATGEATRAIERRAIRCAPCTHLIFCTACKSPAATLPPLESSRTSSNLRLESLVLCALPSPPLPHAPRAAHAHHTQAGAPTQAHPNAGGCGAGQPAQRRRRRLVLVRRRAAPCARIPQLVICEGVSAGILGTSECRIPNQFLQALEELSRSGRLQDCRIHFVCCKITKHQYIQNTDINPAVHLTSRTVKPRRSPGKWFKRRHFGYVTAGRRCAC